MRTSLRIGLLRIVAATCVLVGLAVAAPANAASGQQVRLRDDCNPASFNAVLGAGACVGNGGTTIERFNAELAQKGFVGAWKYDPDNRNLNAGDTLSVFNRGGETHTFTEVAAFGGGFVATLNQASGNPVPAPECASMNADGTLAPQPPSPTNQFVASGTTVNAPPIASGTTVFFQCCIHPWMRIRVTRR